VVNERDLALDDGRALHLYDTGTDDGPAELALLWHHGTPSTGAPPEPLFAAAAERGIRLVSHDRPGYGASTPQPGRDVASAAADVVRVADAVGIDEFVVMGASGGGAHALACAAALPGRVLAAVCMSGPAPFGAEGLDWFAGMTAAGAAEYRAAATGRAALEAHLASAKFDPEDFTPADHAALSGPWSWMGTVVTLALETDRGGIVDDDLAYVTPWGCDLREIAVPVLVVHGAQDRLVPSSHATWLAQRCRTAELWLRPNDGHVSILNSSVMALDWLCEQVSRR
jgi:pimeloyl-ACP methyl ester carboxylesterase